MFKSFNYAKRFSLNLLFKKNLLLNRIPTISTIRLLMFSYTPSFPIITDNVYQSLRIMFNESNVRHIYVVFYNHGLKPYKPRAHTFSSNVNKH